METQPGAAALNMVCCSVGKLLIGFVPALQLPLSSYLTRLSRSSAPANALGRVGGVHSIVDYALVSTS